MNFKKKSTIFTLLSVGLVLALCSAVFNPAEAAVKVGNDSTFIMIGGLLQPWMEITEDQSPDTKSMETEFFIRRVRLMFYGQINKTVGFFVETDNPNFGKGGDLTPMTFIQDAYLELNLKPTIQMDIGMMLLPFSHHGAQGATGLLPIDYHTSLLRYPNGSHKVWRDFGVMLRGIGLNKRVEYRIGLFNGVHGNMKSTDLITADTAGGKVGYKEYLDPRNNSDYPRTTGRLAFNVFNSEGGPGPAGYFYKGINIKKENGKVLSTKKILTIGGSVDWQPDLNVTWDAVPTTASMRQVKSRTDYVATAVDIIADIPLEASKLWSLNGQMTHYYYDYGDRTNGDTWYDSFTGNVKKAPLISNVYTGYGIATELGVRYDALQPIVLIDWYNSTKAADIKNSSGTVIVKGGDNGDLLGVYGGFNYWLFDHATSFKVQFGGAKKNNADKWTMVGTAQAQLLF